MFPIDDLPQFFGPGKALPFNAIMPQTETGRRDFERMIKQLKAAQAKLAKVGGQLFVHLPIASHAEEEE